MKLGQKVNQSIFVPEENLQDWSWLVRVGYKHLKTEKENFIDAHT
jgi:hypothetical protein